MLFDFRLLPTQTHTHTMTLSFFFLRKHTHTHTETSKQTNASTCRLFPSQLIMMLRIPSPLVFFFFFFFSSLATTWWKVSPPPPLAGDKKKRSLQSSFSSPLLFLSSLSFSLSLSLGTFIFLIATAEQRYEARTHIFTLINQRERETMGLRDSRSGCITQHTQTRLILYLSISFLSHIPYPRRWSIDIQVHRSACREYYKSLCICISSSSSSRVDLECVCVWFFVFCHIISF